MDDTLRAKLEAGRLTNDDVLTILLWQLSLPAEEMDCALMRECDLYLAPDGPSLSREREDEMLASLLARIDAQRTRRPTHRAAHRRPRRALLIALLAILLLALAVGGVAYTVRRGVLNFTEDFGFAPMVSQEGADTLVSSGSLAHLSLEHVDVDVTEAVYDGAELRILYSLTSKDGELRLAEHAENSYLMPGEAEGDLHMCDYVRVNGQDAYFYNTWEMPGEAPGQMLYYLQTNLPAWGVDVSGADTLTIGLPMLPSPPDARGSGFVTFTIPAAVPDGLIRTAEIAEVVRDGGYPVTLERSVLSPLNGYVELFFEGLDRNAYERLLTGWCEIYAMDGSRLTDSHPEGWKADGREGGLTLGFAITPPEGEWPEQMILALELSDYSPDWEVILRVK